MQSQTPHIPSPSDDNAIELARSGAWQQIFQTATPTDLSGEGIWPQSDSRHLKEIAQDENLLRQAVQAALAQDAWHFIQQVIHEGFANACPPSTLLTSPNFMAPISAADRPLSDSEGAKISLWRSVLVANPWHTIELSDKERDAWAKLSGVALEALAKTTSPGNSFSNPGHLVHAVDVVNVAINALRHEKRGPLDDVRVGLEEAVSRMIECAGQTEAPLYVTSGALQSLNFPIIIQERAVRLAFFAGIIAATDRIAACSFLHNLASQEGPVSQWTFRVSAASKLMATSPAPVASMFGLLTEAKDPSVLSLAMRTLSHHFEFPLSRTVRDEIARFGPLGGQILSRMLVGADRSHQLSGWYDAYPLLVRQYTQAAAAANVDHGINQTLINSLSVQNGGPLSANQVFEALVGLDPISLEGLATKIRKIIRA